MSAPETSASDLVISRPEGLYCPAGGFHIDPLRPVERAVLTHGHADHARSGSETYWAAASSRPILRQRLGEDTRIRDLEYGERLALGGVEVTLHPAGHILGSAQVRISDGTRTWVVTGDYKRERDPTCEPFETVPCDVLVTEATFALPIYRWPPMTRLVEEIRGWLERCRAQGQAAVLFCYALGKAQRLLAELAPWLDAPVALHGAVVPLVERYREAGVTLPATHAVSSLPRQHRFEGELVLAPPSAAGTPWLKRFPRRSTGFCSGWMRIRGNRRRRGFDRGFVLSDHADWPGLLRTIDESRARRVICMHGRTDVLVRYLRERGIAAETLSRGTHDA